jgi:hypothetical protein
MQNLQFLNQTPETYPPHQNCFDQYASVEIPNVHSQFCYHFKIWRLEKNNMCILVKEGSEILPELKEGDRWNMKYYGKKAICDSEFRETAIHMIKKADQGRFKGHFLVYLDILN